MLIPIFFHFASCEAVYEPAKTYLSLATGGQLRILSHPASPLVLLQGQAHLLASAASLPLPQLPHL